MKKRILRLMLTAFCAAGVAHAAEAPTEDDILRHAEVCKSHHKNAVAKGVTNIVPEEWDPGWKEPCVPIIKQAEKIRTDRYLKQRSEKDAADLAAARAVADHLKNGAGQ